MAAARRKTFSSTQSPLGFTVVDDSIYRTCGPVLQLNIEFIDHLQLTTILNFSTRVLDPPLAAFAVECDITVYNVEASSVQAGETLKLNSADFAAWMKRNLELLISLGNSPLLILGDLESCLDSILIAALRRLQHWSFTSILSEFRSLAGRSIFDFEQMIETFDPSIVDLPRQLPLYISAYKDVLRDEASLGASSADRTGDRILTSEESKFLARIFSSDANNVVSENVTYDSALRYTQYFYVSLLPSPLLMLFYLLCTYGLPCARVL